MITLKTLDKITEQDARLIEALRLMRIEMFAQIDSETLINNLRKIVDNAPSIAFIDNTARKFINKERPSLSINFDMTKMFEEYSREDIPLLYKDDITEDEKETVLDDVIYREFITGFSDWFSQHIESDDIMDNITPKYEKYFADDDINFREVVKYIKGNIFGITINENKTAATIYYLYK